jgi:hypothetical protein
LLLLHAIGGYQDIFPRAIVVHHFLGPYSARFDAAPSIALDDTDDITCGIFPPGSVTAGGITGLARGNKVSGGIITVLGTWFQVI